MQIQFKNSPIIILKLKVYSVTTDITNHVCNETLTFVGIETHYTKINKDTKILEIWSDLKCSGYVSIDEFIERKTNNAYNKRYDYELYTVNQ